MYLRSGHINVTLGRRLADIGNSYTPSDTVTVDLSRRKHSRIARNRSHRAVVIAMYMNKPRREESSCAALDDATGGRAKHIVQSPAT